MSTFSAHRRWPPALSGWYVRRLLDAAGISFQDGVGPIYA
jgi:hypothetical protein